MFAYNIDVNCIYYCFCSRNYSTSKWTTSANVKLNHTFTSI